MTPLWLDCFTTAMRLPIRDEVCKLSTTCSIHLLQNKGADQQFQDKGRGTCSPTDVVERVTSFKFLSAHTSPRNSRGQTTLPLWWRRHRSGSTSYRRAKLSKELLVSIYHCPVESILTFSPLVYQLFREASHQHRNTQLPSLRDIYRTCCLWPATNIWTSAKKQNTVLVQ